jgi:hypothetical protein
MAMQAAPGQATIGFVSMLPAGAAMPRLQDALFVALGVAVATLLALHLRIAVFALLGAFACGSIYLFVGMVPSRTESFWSRLFNTGFLSIVMASLVLILPGTFGAIGPGSQTVVIAIAALLPFAAICFEIVRTPRVTEIIMRSLGQR